ncbi:MAG: hypothetical protein QM765_32780 [Myxococcales bacterium]
MDLRAWVPAFLGTLLCEGPLYFVLLRRALTPTRALLAILALNAATHPLAWHTITSAARPLPWVFLGVEGAVVLGEALMLYSAARTRFFLKALGMGEAVAIALAANAFSAGVGLML